MVMVVMMVMMVMVVQNLVILVILLRARASLEFVNCPFCLAVADRMRGMMVAKERNGE